MDNKYCKWVIRPGTSGSLWAHTPCKHGFNYLSKISRPSEVEDAYNGRLCPICGRTIKIDMSLMVDDMEV